MKGTVLRVSLFNIVYIGNVPEVEKREIATHTGCVGKRKEITYWPCYDNLMAKRPGTAIPEPPPKRAKISSGSGSNNAGGSGRGSSGSGQGSGGGHGGGQEGRGGGLSGRGKARGGRGRGWRREDWGYGGQQDRGQYDDEGQQHFGGRQRGGQQLGGGGYRDYRFWAPAYTGGHGGGSGRGYRF
jgi:hypothetical protein